MDETQHMDKKTQQEMINELEGSDRDVRGFWAFTTIAVAVFLSLYHFYIAGFGLPGIGSKTFLIFHLTLGLVLVFLIFPPKKGLNKKKVN